AGSRRSKERKKREGRRKKEEGRRKRFFSSSFFLLNSSLFQIPMRGDSHAQVTELEAFVRCVAPAISEIGAHCQAWCAGEGELAAADRLESDLASRSEAALRRALQACPAADIRT